MSLSLFNNKNTSIEHADGRPAFFEMTMIGFTSKLYNYNLSSYKIGISHFKKGEVDFISLIPDQEDIGRGVISEYTKNKKGILSLYQKWLKEFKLMVKYYDSFYKKNLSILSDKELLKENENLFEMYSKKVSMPGFIDGFMFYAEKRFNELINEFCKKNKIDDPIKLSSLLTAPTAKSFLNEEEEDLIKIIRSFKGKVNFSSDSFIKKAKKHLLKYSWIKSGYYGYKEYSLDDLIVEVKRINNSSAKEKESFDKNKKKKLELIKKYKFNKEMISIIELSDLLIKWQDQRKQYTLTYITLRNKMLEEVSRRLEIEFDLLTYLLSSEIDDLLNKKIKINKAKERRENVLFVYKKGKVFEVLVGKEVNQFMDQISLKDIKEVLEIKGTVASMGKVQGIVKVVMSSQYLNKIEDGDILVATMTRPEYLAGIRKAVAIITDDGGITCHAAIVSRELKKPCIIGTKIATKTLKDGDLVEVDANKGVIRIIS